ncbi:hypothetical protein CIPAW_03G116600 [Carya illinoinensis]|uniref:Uncharacterized protein n=1 Tax=Carya illinoinensis TaxID=32201 RepID=A0A8T1R170_CARIL|nr:hypothetical protein CIPAW_03G116600 [Carya illinoinensis]
MQTMISQPLKHEDNVKDSWHWLMQYSFWPFWGLLLTLLSTGPQETMVWCFSVSGHQATLRFRLRGYREKTD